MARPSRGKRRSRNSSPRRFSKAAGSRRFRSAAYLSPFFLNSSSHKTKDKKCRAKSRGGRWHAGRRRAGRRRAGRASRTKGNRGTAARSREPNRTQIKVNHRRVREQYAPGPNRRTKWWRITLKKKVRHLPKSLCLDVVSTPANTAGGSIYDRREQKINDLAGPKRRTERHRNTFIVRGKLPIPF